MTAAIQKKTNKNDDAVSPVVGVMLMLVVTIILAAVIALFASNLMTPMEPAPVSVITTTASSDGIMIHHMSGDQLEGSRMKVILSNTDGTGSITSGSVNVGGDGLLTVGEFVDITNSFGSGTELSRLLVSGKMIRVQLTYDDNYVIMDKKVVVERGTGGGIEYLPITLAANTWYKSETEAINAYLGTTNVPTPKAIGTNEIQIKKGATITVSRSGSTDDYTTSPKVVNTIKLSFNGQDAAWAVVSSTAYSSAQTTFTPRNTVTFDGSTTDYTLNFTSSGYQTLATSNTLQEAMTVVLSA